MKNVMCLTKDKSIILKVFKINFGRYRWYICPIADYGRRYLRITMR